MSVLIKGMEMPKDCVVCPFGWNGCNHQHDFVYMGRRPSDCPLVPVSEHGRWEHYEHREQQYDIMGVKTYAEAYKCSNCGFIHSVIEDFGHYAYCPNCGCAMEGEDDATD